MGNCMSSPVDLKADADARRDGAVKEDSARNGGRTFSLLADGAKAPVPQPFNYPQHAVDMRDVGTPDEWVHRHPEQIRLTGRYAPPPSPRGPALPSFFRQRVASRRVPSRAIFLLHTPRDGRPAGVRGLQRWY